MNNKIIDGEIVAHKLKKKYKSEIKKLAYSPKLAVIQIGNELASNIYIKQKKQACLEVGIDFKLIKYDKKVTEMEVIKKIISLNNNQQTTGILLQLPIPKALALNKIINTIDPDKDVDGLTSINIGNIINGIDSNVSCTAIGVIKLLEACKIKLKGKHIVIVGRSNLVSKPLIHLLLNKDATITICHSKTINLKYYTKQADLLIVAIGKPNFIKKEMIKKNAILIDIGINRLFNKIVGDVDFKDVYDKCSLITKVPGGVGPMTIVGLLHNIIKSYLKKGA